jgi:hypothetical protein
MPDEAPKEPLTRDDLHAALKQRITRACPMCGGARWDTSDSTVLVIPAADGPDGPVKSTLIEDNDDITTYEHSGVVALPVVCKGCGFIAQFSYESLRR